MLGHGRDDRLPLEADFGRADPDGPLFAGGQIRGLQSRGVHDAQDGVSLTRFVELEQGNGQSPLSQVPGEIDGPIHLAHGPVAASGMAIGTDLLPIAVEGGDGLDLGMQEPEDVVVDGGCDQGAVDPRESTSKDSLEFQVRGEICTCKACSPASTTAS